MATTGLFTIDYGRNVAASAESDFFQQLVKFFMQMSLQDLYYNLRRNSIRTFNENFDETLQRRSARNEADKLRQARKRSDQLRQIVFILKLRHLLEQYIVPYNPWLIKKFNDDINVEVCAYVKSVKYLYKYVYEGLDAASVRLQSSNSLLNNDEFLTFLDGRYASAPEVMWRLNEISLSEKSHVGNHAVGRSLAKPTASGEKKSSDNATSKFDAFKRPEQCAEQQD
ncbi:hypothetical protein AVEN_147596-1 [Araneus ventricosus]|uniref:Uncharacterized protein n=1 Tax=Araneus ventricosus TaxID=182803 RepID=A0A4Y2H2Y2_ARAVE|nr:hypothetical protein AVEN_147596-1 [Araneus ventricosus]